MTEKEIKDRLILLYRRMYILTLPKCQRSCRVPLSCCSPEYCEMAKQWAKDEWNIELKRTDHPKLPFMGSDGCVVDPHLRPLCTLHVCAINSIGVDPRDPKWTKKYFGLRNRIEKLESIKDSPKTESSRGQDQK